MAKGNEESISGYFRKVFAEHPRLLRGRSNQELLERWLKDHPGHKEVPQKVRANLSNIKSVLRKQARKGGRPKKAATTSAPLAGQAGSGQAPAPSDAPASPLEQLEERIDDCLSLAKSLDRKGLGHVISMLRHARNLVVWQEGK
jgi:hypothetical protein